MTKTKSTLRQRLASLFETRAQKKRKEILKSRNALDRSTAVGENLYNYYGGWLDALDWAT